MPTTDHLIETPCAWCGFADGLKVRSEHVHISNAQVAMQHEVGLCPRCEKMTALARWGRDLRFSYKVLEYRRMLRRSTWVAVYDVICAWCGSKATDPAEINVTV